MTQTIAIIGAGLGGLSCALALARAGQPVRVYEQAPMLAEIGAGITLSSNASRVVIHLGLGEGLKRLGVVPPRQWTQNMTTGEVLVERERGPEMQRLYGAPSPMRLFAKQISLHAKRLLQPRQSRRIFSG